jgi:FkbM family methyltransferase
MLNSVLRWIGHQDWVRYGIRYRIIRKFSNIENLRTCAFDIEFFGMRYDGDLRCYIDWVAYFFGAYEKYELFLLRDLIKDRPKSVFIDIGANIGHHSLFMSQYCDVVHAFEPFGPVSCRLEQKIQRNSISNVVVHKLGLGHEDAELQYFAPKGHNTGTGSFVPSHESENNESSEKLQVVKADAYLSKMGLSNIDLIKIDVEGFEKNVLLGLRESLQRYRPIVFIEFSEETKSSLKGKDEFMSLFPENYKIRTVQTYKPKFVVFSKPGYNYKEFKFDDYGVNLILFPAS